MVRTHHRNWKSLTWKDASQAAMRFTVELGIKSRINLIVPHIRVRIKTKGTKTSLRFAYRYVWVFRRSNNLCCGSDDCSATLRLSTLFTCKIDNPIRWVNSCVPVPTLNCICTLYGATFQFRALFPVIGSLYEATDLGRQISPKSEFV